ncbi:hypothetical protein BN14_03595 [Rhizoctonia solani AG-1 IB]|uniref:Uncharacterized protein n=1 Tax=Thanatephorus cucumeris (strain AG1-IB / isolate 7/3/14) TaxID=1108050 RepID=M5BPD1_THACB|nr:hypothetical protein BN14_03595 [Rhizoctonia solani AG-1 IB]
MHTSITYISALPSSFPSVLPSLHLLSPLPNRKPRVARSPYPVDRKATTPFTPGRKAYNRVKGMFSGFKSIKSLKTASTTGGSDAHAPGGQLALGHVNNTQVECNEAVRAWFSSTSPISGF